MHSVLLTLPYNFSFYLESFDCYRPARADNHAVANLSCIVTGISVSNVVRYVTEQNNVPMALTRLRDTALNSRKTQFEQQQQT